MPTDHDMLFSKTENTHLETAERRSGQLPVLLVDDELLVLKTVSAILEDAGITNVLCCDDARNVMTLLAAKTIGVVVLDLNMPHCTGQELLRRIAHEYPEIPIIVVTGLNDVTTAVESIKAGSFDYLVKPVEPKRMVATIQHAIELRATRDEYEAFKSHLFLDTLSRPQAFEGIVTRNPAMRAIFHYAETIARTPHPVLITGEPGVGKRLLARTVHTLSDRPGPFVTGSTESTNESVFSDMLFGHVRGTDSPAHEIRHGLIEQAADGTLFLDEIGDLDSASQAKLLLLLQENTYIPVGAELPRVARTRLIAATAHDLPRRMAEGRFRKDLYYRLASHHMEVLPLRRRMDDLPLLLDHFIRQAARAFGRPKPAYAPELLDVLARRPYPGNIRELEGIVYDAVSRMRGGTLTHECFGAVANTHEGLQ